MEIKWLLTRFCYKNPSMFCSAIIREDSAFFRDTQLDNVQREKDIGIVNLKWDVSAKSLPPRLSILCINGRRIVRLNGYGRHQGSIAFPYWHTYELTETVIACTEPEQVQERVGSSAERRKWIPSPSLIEKLSAIDRHPQRKNWLLFLFLNGILLGI